MNRWWEVSWCGFIERGLSCSHSYTNLPALLNIEHCHIEVPTSSECSPSHPHILTPSHPHTHTLTALQRDRKDLSHPVHSDNCILNEMTGECNKVPPAYTWRDYRSVLQPEWWHMISYELMWAHVRSCEVMWCPCDVMWGHVRSCDVMYCDIMAYDVMWCHLMYKAI